MINDSNSDRLHEILFFYLIGALSKNDYDLLELLYKSQGRIQNSLPNQENRKETSISFEYSHKEPSHI